MKPSYNFIIAILTFLIVLLVGTLFYHFIENLSWVDSFYFTGVTVTTLGYGDIVPKTDIGKIFTVFFSMASIGIFLFVISSVINNYIQDYMQKTYKDLFVFKKYFNKPKKTKLEKMKVVVEKRR